MRDDVIIATGRSDYPNQVNNVLGFPYIFRGALDVRATTINMEMKIAAAAGAGRRSRARTCPDEVAAAYQGSRPRFGPRLHHPGAVRSAPDPRRMPTGGREGGDGTGVARRPIVDMRGYKAQLSARRDPVAGTLQQHLRARAQRCPSASSSPRARRSRSIRAAVSFVNQGLGTADPGRPRGARARDRRGTRASNSKDARASRSTTRACRQRNSDYAQFLYERLQRKGFLFRDCQRLINQDRNHLRRLAWWRSATPTPW